jgi:hypothetical protein
MNKTGKPLPEIALDAFWDTDKTKLDFNRQKDFIISRMFEKAAFQDVLKVVYYYGLNETKKALKTNKYLSSDGMYLAHIILDIPLKDFATYATSQYD